MDSSELLDILGNENRRKILQLLSHKPCYVTEYIGVSPKAVIDHLETLEEAGLIESYTDKRRRKYFNISRNLRLEVNVSPYSFGVKSAYPGSNFRASYEYIRFEGKAGRSLEGDATENADDESISDLVSALDRLEEVENELSVAQRQVQSRITDIMERIEDRVEDSTENELQAEVLTVLMKSPASVDEIAEQLDVSRDVVRESLELLEKEGIVEREDDGWNLSERSDDTDADAENDSENTDDERHLENEKKSRKGK
ncbi:MAG: ArsR family transcriptional regulator [Halobacteria archaeon]|nr:ArsR family transcriptional regulator [Halobacteria archaeon]